MFPLFKSGKNSGQVSVETLVAVFIVLIFFGIVLVQASIFGSSEVLAKETFEEQNSCLKFSHLISQVYTEGKGSHAEIYLDHNAQVYSNGSVVRVGDHFCYFIAKTIDANLVSGNIILDNNGVVGFSQ